MEINLDRVSDEELAKIIKYAKNNHLFLYQVGTECGVRDKGFWSRIIHGNKPIPPIVREKLNYVLTKGD